MTYSVGTHIDLNYLNKKSEVVPIAPRKSLQETSNTLFEVGTQFVFDQAQKKLARRIQVVYA